VQDRFANRGDSVQIRYVLPTVDDLKGGALRLPDELLALV
jgi:hypothetical protein